ncbi:hypothetical protein [Streptomyces olivochromogenes]|uniref:Tetratricopeptide repeat protein n=1 Tax=Streptomyces olivochromogenes TaxID=1963 RepID=A0A250V699_STROL|nr:hypothetical protein [Streptomyces olivochromogenes]KUN49867.1 hypothetical protein AQJ27_00510 [Streptomyces olivochromogenes]GAX49622.1 hypothetical protein SO3561_01111 [Streptomyces olivochromogenes]
MTNTASTLRTAVPLDELIAAARELRIGGRWERATRLLDSAGATDPRSRARLALAAAEVALESDWFGGTALAGPRLAAAEEFVEVLGESLDGRPTDEAPSDIRWDLDFLRLRHGYLGQVRVDGAFRAGPDGKDPDAPAALRTHAERLRGQAPDDVRRGWAEMYLGLVADNLFAERDLAPGHYEAALRAGEAGEADDSGAAGATGEAGGAGGSHDSGDDLLVREALRHLGDHDHDHGDHARARERWSRATELGARAGTVPGTLSQQLLLAVLARDAGDEAGAVALVREIARWAGAIGAVTTEAQARGFLTGIDPTAPPVAAESGS